MLDKSMHLLETEWVQDLRVILLTSLVLVRHGDGLGCGELECSAELFFEANLSANQYLIALGLYTTTASEWQTIFEFPMVKCSIHESCFNWNESMVLVSNFSEM